MDSGKIYPKREDLNHTGAHKINNRLGRDCSLSEWARSESSRRRARDNMVATATVAPCWAWCDVYMGEEDIRRQGSTSFE
jgi:tryptophan synthase beta chain